jgi:hypothetical protein
MFRFASIDYNKYNKYHDLIGRLLLERCPELDINGIEKQIFISCKDDLCLYIMYLRENHLVTDELFMEYFATFVLNFDLGIDHSIQPILTTEQEIQYDIDCEKLAVTLVDEWWTKMQIRTEVKLIRPKNPPMMIGMNKNIFTHDEMDDLRYYIAMILLKNGERCFINLMITNLIAGVIMTKVNPTKTTFTEQDKLQLTQAIGFEARELSKRTGPLIWLFVDKNYFSSKMREFHDPNNFSVI